MISSLRGIVLSTAGGSAVIEVGGVGFSVTVTPDHALAMRVGQQTRVLTTLIVRDDSLSLFGFAEQDQLEVFELLTGVTGVGPKSAMGVLAVLSPEQIAVAVADENDSAFRAVSGIGPKTAKLIVLSLAGKLAVVRRRQTSQQTGPASSVSGSVLVALVGLGWPEKTAAEAIRLVVAETPEAERDSVPLLLRHALAQLGPAQSATTVETGER
ncbi:Holliday junction branch migration protein RuvA [Rathayibacter soli]|uniref:Holliday junction branch migration protein RuvA n=1 Tax=Rathayibacter soli TaxID=3144168 RepID=UPI0027E3CAE8|nr:Holliday junction branch migration protein RuvA [Glaciibacter superstes]